MQEALICSALLLTLALRNPAQPVRGGKIPVDWTQARIRDTDEVLNLVLNQAEGMDWMVGVKVKAEAENTISVGDGTRGLMFQRVTGQPETQPKVVGHAPDQMSVSGSSISISGGAEGQVLIVYVELSHARDITIRDAKGLSNFARVSDGILIDNGNVLKNSRLGQGELVQMAILGLNSIRRSFGRGPVVAPASPAWPEPLRDELSLRLHLTQKIDFEPVSPPSSPVRFYARFTISPAGDVMNVSFPDLPRVSPNAIEAIRSTIARWMFLPFLVNGHPEEVSAQLAIMVLPDGTVQASISPNTDRLGLP